MGEGKSFFIIDDYRCDGCGQCVDACPLHSINDADGIFVVDKAVCDGCGTCAESCHTYAFWESPRDQDGGQAGVSGMRAVLRPDPPNSWRARDIYSRSVGDAKANRIIFLPQLLYVVLSLVIGLALFSSLPATSASASRTPGRYISIVAIIVVLVFAVVSYLVSLWTDCMAAQVVRGQRAAPGRGLGMLIDRLIPAFLASVLWVLALVTPFMLLMLLVGYAHISAGISIIFILLMIPVAMLLALARQAVIYDRLGPVAGIKTSAMRVKKNFGRVFLFFLFTAGLAIIFLGGMVVIVMIATLPFQHGSIGAEIGNFVTQLAFGLFQAVIALATMRLYAVLRAPGAADSESALPEQPPLADAPTTP